MKVTNYSCGCVGNDMDGKSEITTVESDEIAPTCPFNGNHPSSGDDD